MLGAQGTSHRNKGGWKEKDESPLLGVRKRERGSGNLQRIRRRAMSHKYRERFGNVGRQMTSRKYSGTNASFETGKKRGMA